MERFCKKSVITTILISVLACVLAVLSVFVFAPMSEKAGAENDPGVWDGDLIAAGWGDEADKVVPEDYVVTNESGETVITIGSAAAFAYFAHEVYLDGSTRALDNATVKLTADIDLGNKMWIPIGQTDRTDDPPAYGFSGTFDGQGHTISNFSTADFFDNLKYNASDKFYIEYTRGSDGKTAKIPFRAKGDEEYSYGLFGVTANITVKNLTVKGVDFTINEIVLDGAPKKLLPDSVGAVIGYGMGGVVMENCVGGSLETTDKITVNTNNNGSYAGLVGRIYAGIDSARSAPYGTVIFDDCVNYVDFDYNGVSSKVSGIVGYAQFFLTCVIEDCVNYGDIDGGQYVGGITSYWSNQITTVDVAQHFEISRCDNYGNISTVKHTSANGRDTAGIIGQLRGADSNSNEEHCPIRIIVQDCNNYGNISSKEKVGGIISWYRNTSGITATIADNYNYGNIYCYGTATAGGYIASFEVHRGDAHLSGELTASGGNVGTVYGAGTRVGSNFGNNGLNFPNNAEHDRKTELFYVDAGEAVVTNVANIPEAATEHVNYTPVRYDKTAAVDDETFKYSGADKKEIIGFAVGVTAPATLRIPATVEKIGRSAFAGQSNITAVEFAADGVLSEIGEFAFSGTGLTEIEFPDSLSVIGVAAFADTGFAKLSLGGGSLTEIGQAAFANCKSLNYVELTESAAAIELGSGVFNGTRLLNGVAQGAFLIAADSDCYRRLVASAYYTDYLDALTYEVTIDYVYDGIRIADATEKRLRGQAYNITYDAVNDKWDVTDIASVGPTSDTVNYVWYDSLERNNVATQIDDVTALLAEVSTDGITLYAFPPATGEKVFIARNGIAYDKNKSYALSELNTLLYASSDLITGTMDVSVKSYNGDTENVPNVIHNAGAYVIEVVDGDDTYEFTVTVERAVMDLASLDNLEWNLTAIGDDATSAQLIDSTLYIYTYAGGDNAGKEYPASQLLTAKQIADLGLNNTYATREVRYSVVRNRGKQVKVEITGDGYTVNYTQNAQYSNTDTAVGAYTAQAVLTADDNYTFTVGNISSLRGMTIDASETTATVTKRWYIVDLGNWLVAQGGGDYTIVGHTYGNGGSALQITAPALAYNGTGGNITMHLYRNNTLIGSAEGFGATDFARYINRVMPAGDYRLEVSVEGVTTVENDVEIYRNGFNETLRFTVDKATLPSLTALNAALKGKTFTFDKDSDRLYDDAAAAEVNALLGTTANLGRDGTIWSSYNDLYGDFAISYNLARRQSDEYVAALNATAADTYTVYYRISAPNYYSSIDNLGNDETRYNYYFTLVKYETLDIPTVVDDGLVYTGVKTLPEITESGLYEIVWSETDAYVAGGEHSVSFKLYDAVHYRWKGISGDTATVSYTVAKADNAFTVSLNMLGWSFETFDAAVNNIRAAAKFLDEDENILFRVVKKGETTALDGLDGFTIDGNGKVTETVAALLNALSTGEYTLYAKVNGTDNYKELERNIDFAVSKAMNSWASGEGDLVLPSWIVGEYSATDNPITVNAAHGNTNVIITDMDGNEFYNSVTGVNKLDECKVGKYLLKAWVDETDDFAALAERTFTIEVFDKVGMPWWGTLLIVVGALAVAAGIILILWKKGVFQILTGKIVLAIRTRANVDATIASVRAAKKTEEGKKSVAEAKRKEAAQARKEKAAAERALPAEARAAALEAKAQAEAERIERIRARMEALKARAERMREESEQAVEQTAAKEAAATENVESTEQDDTAEK